MVLDLQKFLFESAPTRRALLGYSAQCKKSYRVQVFRNHSFELVEHTMGAYLDYAEIGIDFSYSGYDDSLTFLELDASVDMVLVWMDLARYNAVSCPTDFLRERLGQLRLHFSGPVLAIPLGGELSEVPSGMAVLRLSAIERELGERFLDERAQAVAGTRLSAKAMLAVSRELGLRWLPALLRPALKAVVVDLDNTLYRGVLGEDGIHGVVLSEGHRRLQETLKGLAAEGFFLCAVSKNDADDVRALWRDRPDFPLREEDFTEIRASWDAKADSIAQIVRMLNIHPDSVLFIDDNIGELAAVRMAFPAIRVLHAWEDGGMTSRALREFPGLLRLHGSEADAKRKQDVRANVQRKAMRHTLSPEGYIRSLEIRLRFSCDRREQAGRIAELANKTNQFIFGYRRYSEPEIEARMASGEYAVVSVSLSDKLSDSGLIGACIGRAKEDYVEIEECFISCRALGRGIDDVIVLGGAARALRRLKKEKVRFRFRKGARNLPAERFAGQYLSAYLEQPGDFSFTFPDCLTVEQDG